MAAYPVMEQTAEYTGKIRVKQSSWTREVTRGGGSGETDYVDLMLSTYQEEMAALRILMPGDTTVVLTEGIIRFTRLSGRRSDCLRSAE